MEAHCEYIGKVSAEGKDTVQVSVAEIYDKGYKAGISKVVEWAEQDCDCGMNLLITHWQCPTCRRAFKEERGIEK